MSLVGPAGRFLYMFDGTANLGLNLTGTAGQVGEFDPPNLNEVTQELTGSASTYPTHQRVGHVTTDDVTIPLWADSTLQGLIDDLHGTTEADRRNARILVYGWMGADAAGITFTAGRAYLQKVTPKTPPAELTQLETTWRFENAAEIGTVLRALSAATADGDTTGAGSQDYGASTALGGTAYWGYTALNLDSGTAFAPRVVDSADDVTYAALATFTSVTATTGGGQRLALSPTATVRRHLACDWDFTGTPGGSATCTFWVGFVRNLA